MTGRLAYRKVLGTKNPADVLTKHVPAELLQKHLETLGVEFRGGRAESAPELNSVESVVLEVSPAEVSTTRRLTAPVLGVAIVAESSSLLALHPRVRSRQRQPARLPRCLFLNLSGRRRR